MQHTAVIEISGSDRHPVINYIIFGMKNGISILKNFYACFNEVWIMKEL